MKMQFKVAATVAGIVSSVALAGTAFALSAVASRADTLCFGNLHKIKAGQNVGN